LQSERPTRKVAASTREEGKFQFARVIPLRNIIHQIRLNLALGQKDKTKQGNS